MGELERVWPRGSLLIFPLVRSLLAITTASRIKRRTNEQVASSGVYKTITSRADRIGPWTKYVCSIALVDNFSILRDIIPCIHVASPDNNAIEDQQIHLKLTKP